MLLKKRYFLCILIALVPSLCAKKIVDQRRSFVIVTASYNNEEWAPKYLESVFSQDYKNFRVIYCDDGSTDKTLKIVTEFVRQHHLKDKISIIHNANRVGPHENYYKMIHSCKDSEIIAIVDGDDWLAHDKVLSRLVTVYNNPLIWLTYGQFQTFPSGKKGFARQVPQKIIEQNNIRSYPWVTSHLRTFYAWLYKLIRQEDLMFDGKFIRRCGDVAIMLPMVEMAGFHSKFISDILLIYNRANENNYGKPLGDAFVSMDERNAIQNELRKKRPKYQPLKLDQAIVEKLCGFRK